MGGPGGRGEPWRAGADLALEHAAGVGRHVVEDDVGGRGVAEHLYSTVQYSTVQYSTAPPARTSGTSWCSGPRSGCTWGWWEDYK